MKSTQLGQPQSSQLQEIRRKVEAGERSRKPTGCCSTIPRSPFRKLGELANIVRERINGNFGYYNINTHLNPTNVCVYRCNFCAFAPISAIPRAT
jgi:aminodeoxyfutalosine synthase